MKQTDKKAKQSASFANKILKLSSKLYNTVLDSNCSYNQAICAMELCRVWCQVEFIRTINSKGRLKLDEDREKNPPAPDLCSGKTMKFRKKEKTKIIKQESDVMFI